MVQIDNYIRYFGRKQPNCRMTLTVHNLPYLSQSIEELHNRGFKSFSVIPDSDCGQWDSEHFAEYESEMSKVFQYWSRHNDISVNTIEQTIMKLVKKQEKRNLCPVGRGIVGITVDGDIYPCHDFAGKFACDAATRAEMILGNVCEGYLPRRREACDPVLLREVVSGNGHNCSTCWARWACSRGCPYMNYARTGDIRTANAVYCATMRINATLALQWMSALGQFRFVPLNRNTSGKAVQRVVALNDGTAGLPGELAPRCLRPASAPPADSLYVLG
jgi:radical SAM protein with 4Fe4S-binding SPASM domain